MTCIGFPSDHVAYRQLVPCGNEVLPTVGFAVRSRVCAETVSHASPRFLFHLGRVGHPDYRGLSLPLTDARMRLVLAARFFAERVLRGGLARLGAGLSLQAGSGCGLTGWGCVLRTASASILCRSALVGLEDFVICRIPFELPPSLAERSTFNRREIFRRSRQDTAARACRDENRRLSLSIRFNRPRAHAQVGRERSEAPAIHACGRTEAGHASPFALRATADERSIQPAQST